MQSNQIEIEGDHIVVTVPSRVRFGSLADIRARTRDVRFTPECGPSQSGEDGPLSARCGHQA